MTVRLNTSPRVTSASESWTVLWDDIADRRDWTADAACRGYPDEWWFPAQGYTNRRAVAICRTCSVQDDCLDYALELSLPAGIWGGYGVNQRARIKRERTGLSPSRTCPECGGRKGTSSERCYACRANRSRLRSTCECGAGKHHAARSCRACYEKRVAGMWQ